MKYQKGRIYLKIATTFFVVLLTCSIVQIICYFWENWSNSRQLAELSEFTEISEIDDDVQEIVTIEQDEEPVQTDPYWQFLDTKLIDVDFEQLKQTNSDVVGWVQVSGTNINYPFVQTTNNKYYLNHSFDRSTNSAGWVFLDYRNNITDLTSEHNLILYAHGRMDQSMFGSLRKVLESSWQQNTNNFVVRLATENSSSLWQIFSVYHLPITSDYIQTDFSSETEYREFLDMIAGRTAFDFKTGVTTNDQILTLSTCYNNSERLVLHAKLLKYAN